MDSNDCHAHARVEALAEHGIRVSFEKVRKLIGMGGDKLLPAVAVAIYNDPADLLAHCDSSRSPSRSRLPSGTWLAWYASHLLWLLRTSIGRCKSRSAIWTYQASCHSAGVISFSRGWPVR